MSKNIFAWNHLTDYLPNQLAWLVVPLLLAATGCGSQPSALPTANGVTSTLAAQPAQVAPEIAISREMLDVSLLANLVRPNPFESLIMPPTPPEGQAAEETVVEAPPPPEPFTGLNVAGIMYRGKRSSVILTVAGDGSKIVHLGDTLKTPLYNIKVAKIEQNAVTLQVDKPGADLPTDMRSKTFKLPSLIGYKNSGSASSGGSSGSSSAGSSGGAAQQSSSVSGPSEPLPQEIQELVKSTGSAATGSTKR